MKPSLDYWLASYNIPRKKYDQVHQMYMSIILQKMGINSKFPRAIIYGEHHFLGPIFFSSSGLKPGGAWWFCQGKIFTSAEHYLISPEIS